MTPLPKSTIRPARGLWAAVSPNGEISVGSLSYTAKAGRERAERQWLAFGGWPALRKRGWRIIRVDVIPHEEGE